MAFIIPLILFLLSGFTSILISNKRMLSLMFIITSLASFLLSLHFLNTIHSEVSYIFGGFSQDIGIEYTANPFKLALASFLCGIILIFSIFINGFVRYFKEEFSFSTLFCMLQIMCGSAIALVFTNDLFNFYIFLELLAICCYVLTAFGRTGATFASFNYLFLGIIASGFLVLGIGILYFSTGYLNITKVAIILKENHTIKGIIPFAFILTGFLIKLAIFPFSFWPGLVYKYFPSSILPLYGSIVSLITFYGLFLFKSTFFVLEANNIRIIILALCSAGVLIFSFFSLFENNVKKILAYSSMGQVSYALFLLFFESKTLNALAFFHLFSNSISKIALFIILFEVLKYKQNAVISAFESLSEKSKFLSITILFFFANIVGLPIMLGFFTKASIVLNLIPLNQYIFIILILVGAVLNFLYFWRIASVMFYPKNKEEQEEDGFSFKIKIDTKTALSLLIIATLLSTIFFSEILTFLSVNIT